MDDEALRKIYFNPKHPAGFSGAKKFQEAVLKSGLNYSEDQIRNWLMKNDTFTLHYPVRYHFPRTRTLAKGINYQWQSDLIDMTPPVAKANNGFRYIVTAIDVFSKKAWAEPTKTKSAEDVKNALVKILARAKVKPLKLQTDKGKEYLNQVLKPYLSREGIVHFTTHNQETKAAVVERFNRTLKEKLWKYFTHKGSYRYLDVVDDFLDAYNNSYHRSIGMSPAEVNFQNQDLIWKRLYGEKSPKKKKFKFNIGDQVRISKARAAFQKGYEENWTDEIFFITHREMKDYFQPVYKIKDYSGEEILGTFYEHELQKIIKAAADKFAIERVLRWAGKKGSGNRKALIRWKGFGPAHDSWVPEEDIVDIQQA